jgi:hypothetical protein
MNKDYLKKRNRSNKAQYNKKNHGQKEFAIEFNHPNIEEVETKEKEVMKIGKHWEGINKIEPKNTTGKLYFYEKENVFLSIVENTLRIFDINDLKLLKTIKQVSINYY